MRPKYRRFIELMNEGAGELGYGNVGELWRSGYDMDAEAFAAELERLWGQVEPLYEGLHCYVRERLADYYGDELVDRDGPIPAHLLGNMWAQEWGNIYPLVEPYQDVSDLNVTGALEAMRAEKLDQFLDDVEGEPSAFDIVNAHRKADDEADRWDHHPLRGGRRNERYADGSGPLPEGEMFRRATHFGGT